MNHCGDGAAVDARIRILLADLVEHLRGTRGIGRSLVYGVGNFLGTVIHHALAIGALALGVVEPSLAAALMPPSRCSHRLGAS